MNNIRPCRSLALPKVEKFIFEASCSAAGQRASRKGVGHWPILDAKVCLGVWDWSCAKIAALCGVARGWVERMGCSQSRASAPTAAELDLAGRKLTVVPDEALTGGFVKIDLSQNELSELPASIGQLRGGVPQGRLA